MGILNSLKLVVLLAGISTIIFLFAITFVVIAQEIHFAVGLLFFASILYIAFRVLRHKLTKL
jgi:hypothetical protein